MSRRRTQGRGQPKKKSNPRLSRADQEAAARAHEVTQRAIRRLDMLEWVVFGVGAVVAMVAGAAVAWVLAGAAGWDFRSTWIAASLLLFVIPGAYAIMKIRKDERADAARRENRTSTDG